MVIHEKCGGSGGEVVPHCYCVKNQNVCKENIPHVKDLPQIRHVAIKVEKPNVDRWGTTSAKCGYGGRTHGRWWAWSHPRDLTWTTLKVG